MNTIETVKKDSPELLLNEVDKRVVKIRPMSTPIDQISRLGGSRRAGSMTVDYYSVDTKPTEATLVTQSPGGSWGSTGSTSVIVTDNNAIFAPSDTVLIPDVAVTDENGVAGKGLVVYVYDASGSEIKVLATNNYNGKKTAVPTIPEGSKLIRMGRAATELDVQTGHFDINPVKNSNNCQIFKTQIEQSTFLKISNKEVGWDFSDQEEAAVIDMRLGMEKTFLFGVKGRFNNPDKGEDVLLTGGIWNQTDNEWECPEKLTDSDIVSMMRKAFTENAGSSRKILIGGSEFIEQLHNLDVSRVVKSTETVTKWGIDFTEMVSKFGTLYVVMSEVFDQCGHGGDAMVIDPEYITKYSHVPFRTERLDLRSSGQRNTDAIVITEASCVVLRYPRAHMKIVKKG